MPYLNQLIKQMVPFTLKLGMIFLALCFLSWIGGSILFTSASNNLVAKQQRVMSVTGSAKKKVTPDSAQITLGKTLRGTNAVDLQTKAGTAVNTLTDKLLALGITAEEIRTSNYSVNPTYDNNGEVKGYEVNVSVEITLEKQNPQQKLLGDIITAGTQSGIDVVNGLNFYLSDYDQQVKDLQTAAIADAKANAEKQAQAAGTRLGAVINIGSNNYPYYYNGLAAPQATSAGKAEDVGSTPSVQFSAGQFDLQASVSVTYELN